MNILPGVQDTPGSPDRDRSSIFGNCPVSVNRGLERFLARLDEAWSPTDMDLPGFRLHPLKSVLAGYRTVQVSGDWRIVSRLDGDDVRDVDPIDYH